MSAAVIEGLNGVLADGTVLYQKLRHYHWNVNGPHFFELHGRFEELYTRWADINDELAERILMVGGAPIHTLEEVLRTAGLSEDPQTPEPAKMVERVVADLRALHESTGAVLSTAEAAGDRGTVNLLDGLRDGLEKDVWMLEAWLEKAPAWK